MTDNLPVKTDCLKSTDTDTDKKESKQQLLVRYIFSEPTIKQAALKAGYSPNMVKSNVYQIIKTPAFQTMLRDHAISNDLLDIPQLQRIESRILSILEAKPEDYPKYKQIFSEKKRIAGILQSEEQPVRVQQVNIGQIQVMINQAGARHLRKTSIQGPETED